MKTYEVDIMNLQRAESAGARGRRRPGRGAAGGGASLKAKTVIISTGARWRQMNVPGENEYRNKGVAYCPHRDGPLFKGKRVAVIGGGNSGVEAAIDLAGMVSHVTLHRVRRPAARRRGAAAQAAQPAQRRRDRLRAQTTEVRRRRCQVTGLALHRTAATGETRQRRAGRHLRPDRPAAQHRMARRAAGPCRRAARSRWTSHGATSVPGVFAAGDVTTTPYKQIVTAMGEGSSAALSAFDHLIRTSAPAEQQQAAWKRSSRRSRVPGFF